MWRKRWDSNPRAREDYLISSQARYDHFDTLPYINFSSTGALANVPASIRFRIIRRALRAATNYFTLYPAGCQVFLRFSSPRESRFFAFRPPRTACRIFFKIFSSLYLTKLMKCDIVRHILPKILTKTARERALRGTCL